MLKAERVQTGYSYSNLAPGRAFRKSCDPGVAIGLDAMRMNENERQTHKLKESDDQYESRLVFEYFMRRQTGVFVEVGANHPRTWSQTCFLEQRGWRGVLVEPNAKLCVDLRQQRPKSLVFEMAVGSPFDGGEADLHLGFSDGHSAIKPQPGAALTGETIKVALRTLDGVLEQAGVGKVDFVSIDVEGMELGVLRGFDLGRWQPKLVVIEDTFVNHHKPRYLKSRQYRLIRRTGYNNWYVPRETPVSLFSASTPRELLRLIRKFWLNPAYETVRRKWKARRKGVAGGAS